mgnify:CR=1 FL=1
MTKQVRLSVVLDSLIDKLQRNINVRGHYRMVVLMMLYSNTDNWGLNRVVRPALVI